MDKNVSGNILILVSDAGYGHRSAANALVESFKRWPNLNVQIENPMDVKSVPLIIKETEDNYDSLVNKLPELYLMAYKASNFPPATSMLEAILSVTLYDAVRKTIEKYKPDLIISLFPYYQAPLGTYFALNRIDIPIVTVVTDLTTLQRIWFSPASTLTVVPTEPAKKFAVKTGLKAEDVKLIGIPVSPEISTKKNKKQTREKLGWEQNCTTFLVVGSKRVQNLKMLLRGLNHSGLEIQLILVAGGDEELYEDFKQTEWHHPTKIYNFVENMPDFYHGADAVICKAGGLMVTEALASGLPLLLIGVIEGQETGNAEYVVEAEAGVRVKDASELLETVFHWVKDRKIPTLSKNALSAAQPKAAAEVAATAIDLMVASTEKLAKPLVIDKSALERLFESLNIGFDRK